MKRTLFKLYLLLTLLSQSTLVSSENSWARQQSKNIQHFSNYIAFDCPKGLTDLQVKLPVDRIFIANWGINFVQKIFNNAPKAEIWYDKNYKPLWVFFITISAIGGIYYVYKDSEFNKILKEIRGTMEKLNTNMNDLQPLLNKVENDIKQTANTIENFSQEAIKNVEYALNDINGSLEEKITLLESHAQENDNKIINLKEKINYNTKNSNDLDRKIKDLQDTFDRNKKSWIMLNKDDKLLKQSKIIDKEKEDLKDIQAKLQNLKQQFITMYKHNIQLKLNIHTLSYENNVQKLIDGKTFNVINNEKEALEALKNLKLESLTKQENLLQNDNLNIEFNADSLEKNIDKIKNDFLQNITKEKSIIATPTNNNQNQIIAFLKPQQYKKNILDTFLKKIDDLQKSTETIISDQVLPIIENKINDLQNMINPVISSVNNIINQAQNNFIQIENFFKQFNGEINNDDMTFLNKNTSLTLKQEINQYSNKIHEAELKIKDLNVKKNEIKQYSKTNEFYIACALGIKDQKSTVQTIQSIEEKMKLLENEKKLNNEKIAAHNDQITFFEVQNNINKTHQEYNDEVKKSCNNETINSEQKAFVALKNNKLKHLENQKNHLNKNNEYIKKQKKIIEEKIQILTNAQKVSPQVRVILNENLVNHENSVLSFLKKQVEAIRNDVTSTVNTIEKELTHAIQNINLPISNIEAITNKFNETLKKQNLTNHFNEIKTNSIKSIKNIFLSKNPQELNRELHAINDKIILTQNEIENIINKEKKLHENNKKLLEEKLIIIENAQKALKININKPESLIDSILNNNTMMNEWQKTIEKYKNNSQELQQKLEQCTKNIKMIENKEYYEKKNILSPEILINLQGHNTQLKQLELQKINIDYLLRPIKDKQKKESEELKILKDIIKNKQLYQKDFVDECELEIEKINFNKDANDEKKQYEFLIQLYQKENVLIKHFVHDNSDFILGHCITKIQENKKEYTENNFKEIIQNNDLYEILNEKIMLLSQKTHRETITENYKNICLKAKQKTLNYKDSLLKISNDTISKVKTIVNQIPIDKATGILKNFRWPEFCIRRKNNQNNQNNEM